MPCRRSRRNTPLRTSADAPTLAGLSQKNRTPRRGSAGRCRENFRVRVLHGQSAAGTAASRVNSTSPIALHGSNAVTPCAPGNSKAGGNYTVRISNCQSRNAFVARGLAGAAGIERAMVVRPAPPSQSRAEAASAGGLRAVDDRISRWSPRALADPGAPARRNRSTSRPVGPGRFASLARGEPAPGRALNLREPRAEPLEVRLHQRWQQPHQHQVRPAPPPEGQAAATAGMPRLRPRRSDRADPPGSPRRSARRPASRSGPAAVPRNRAPAGGRLRR